MIDYPTVICEADPDKDAQRISPASSSSSSSSGSSAPSMREYRALRAKLWTSRQLTRVVLGRDAKDLKNQDIMQAIKVFAEMKQELSRLQRESQLTQRALVATQCCETSVAKRVAKLEEDQPEALESSEPVVAPEPEDGDASEPPEEDEAPEPEAEDPEAMMSGVVPEMDEEDADEANEEHSVQEEIEEEIDEEDDDDDRSVGDATTSSQVPQVAEPEENLEEEIRSIQPSVQPRRVKSLGSGLIDDVEKEIVVWQSAFEKLNEQHRAQVQACQQDMERWHQELNDVIAASLGQDGIIPEEAKRARLQLEKLAATVDAFPSQAKIDTLRTKLEESRKAERKSQLALARALQELEMVRQRERALLMQAENHRREREMSEAASEAAAASVSGRRPVAVRFLRKTRKVLQRLFLLDRSSRRRNAELAQEDEEDNNSLVHPTTTLSSSHVPSADEVVNLSSVESHATADLFAALDTRVLELQNLGSNDDDNLLVFCPSDHGSSINGETEEDANGLSDLLDDDDAAVDDDLSFDQDFQKLHSLSCLTADYLDEKADESVLTDSLSLATTTLTAHSASPKPKERSELREEGHAASKATTKETSGRAHKERTGIFSKAKTFLGF